MSLLIKLIFWALLIIVMAQSPTQPVTPIISGQVRTLGHPVPNHTVWLISRAGDPTHKIISHIMTEAESTFNPAELFPTATVFEETTDETGNFIFERVPYDSHWLVTLAPQDGTNPFFIHYISMTTLMEVETYRRDVTFSVR